MRPRFKRKPHASSSLGASPTRKISLEASLAEVFSFLQAEPKQAEQTVLEGKHHLNHPFLPEQNAAQAMGKAVTKQRQRTFARRYMRQWGLFKGTAAGSLHHPSANHYGFAASTFAASMRYALEGLAFAVQHERNLRIDFALSAMTVALAFYLHVSLAGWLTLIQALGCVLVAELVNTVLEWLVDLLTEGRFDLRAKRIKDMAAAACLVVAVVSFTVVGLVFWPYAKALFLMG
jgi:undecaprenol kinase